GRLQCRGSEFVGHVGSHGCGCVMISMYTFFFQAEDGIRDPLVTGVQTCALPIYIATPDAGAGQMKQLSRAIEEFLNKLPLEFDELVNCHDVRVRQVEHHILVSCHCTMRSELPITQIHDVTAALEDRVKEKFPQIYRLTIHPEPFEEK